MNGISIIVPFLNEEDGITYYCEELDRQAENANYEIQLVFVDDGSDDQTVEVLKKFEFHNVKKKKIVRLSQNCGSHAAIRAGLLSAEFDICTWMGCDLQEPLEFLDRSYEIIKSGYDAVYIEKRSINVSALNRCFSLIYSALMKKYAVKNYASSGISNIVFNKKIKTYLNENVESNSSIMLQIMAAGFSYKILSLDYKERVIGYSKWTLSKKIKLFIDSFVSFSFMPIRLVSLIGILMFGGGIIFGAYEIVYKLMNPAAPVPGYITLAILIAVGFGMTNINLGIIAEYLWRTYDAARKRPEFIISEIEEL